MSEIFRKYQCDFCGKVEYKKYVGQREFDGGYTSISMFEPSDFEFYILGEKSYVTCPECKKEILNFLEKLKQKRRKDIVQ